jgi:hypothetical protein
LALDGDLEDKNSTNNMTHASNISKYEIVLIKGGRFSSLTTNTKSDFDSWRKHLSKLCVTTELSADLVEIIGYQSQFTKEITLMDSFGCIKKISTYIREKKSNRLLLAVKLDLKKVRQYTQCCNLLSKITSNPLI